VREICATIVHNAKVNVKKDELEYNDQNYRMNLIRQGEGRI